MTYQFEENELFEQLIQQETSAVRSFVEKGYTQLKKSLHFSEISADEYDDLIQDTFAVFFNSLPKFKKQSQLSTFLWGIFYNKLREARRKYRKTPTPVAEVYDDQFDNSGHWMAGVHIEDPESWENYSQLNDIIEACLEKLPFLHKQVVLLQASSEMNKEEICHSLEINNTNYRQCLSRGRKSLRTCVDDEFSKGV